MIMRGQLRPGGESKERKKEKAVRVSGFERGSASFPGRGYELNFESSSEEWDRLAQNPFLAFYQRWPWFAHNTPLLNLWNNLLRHSRRIFFWIFFLEYYCEY